jgi:hypothetical protein
MKTLLAYSGGLDSIYVLWKELTQTSNDVTAVFFDSSTITEDQRILFSMKGVDPVSYSEEQWIACLQSCEVIMGATRSFELQKMSYNPAYINPTQVQYNHGAVFRTAAAVDSLNNGTFDRYVTGHCRDNDGYTASLSVSWRPGTASSLSLEYFKAHATRGEFAVPLYDMQYTTANALYDLPQELIDVQSAVLMGANDNTHYKWAMQTYARRLLVEGKTTAQIYDIITEKSVLPNNVWRSQKRWLSNEVPEYVSDLSVDWPMPNWASSYTVPG